MLEEILLGLGGNVLAKVIGKKFGPEMGDLSKAALEELGKVFGVEPKPEVLGPAIQKAQAEQPAETTARVKYAEANLAAELLAQAEVLKAANEQQRQTNDLLMNAAKEPGWKSNWLYAWQWFLMACWAWTIFVVHILNAVLRLSTGASAAEAVSLPAPDLGVLTTLTGLYLGLHMGGHTVLELMRNKWGGIFDRKAEDKA